MDAHRPDGRGSAQTEPHEKVCARKAHSSVSEHRDHRVKDPFKAPLVDPNPSSRVSTARRPRRDRDSELIRVASLGGRPQREVNHRRTRTVPGEKLRAAPICGYVPVPPKVPLDSEAESSARSPDKAPFSTTYFSTNFSNSFSRTAPEKNVFHNRSAGHIIWSFELGVHNCTTTTRSLFRPLISRRIFRTVSQELPRKRTSSTIGVQDTLFGLLNSEYIIVPRRRGPFFDHLFLDEFFEQFLKNCPGKERLPQ